MWKYVSRRFKDSVEKTYNVLESQQKAWTLEKVGGGPLSVASSSSSPSVHYKHQDVSHRNNCSENKSYNLASFDFQKQQFDVYKVNNKKWNGSSSSNNYRSSSSGQDDFNQQHHGCPIQENILGAITWSSAIICGWYTSQILCMRRRHLLQSGYKSRCNFSNALLVPTRLFHSTVLSHIALTSPVRTQRQSLKSWIETENLTEYQPKNAVYVADNFDTEKESIFDINNENLQLVEDVQAHNDNKAEQKKQTVESAVQHLLSILGNIEFQLGIQSIHFEEFGVAASHFKLAASHHHAGATFNLGICFEEGLGVEKNLKIALDCYQVASEMGHPKAMYNVGIFYVHGLGGLKKNRKLAKQYFMAAAKLGQFDAQKALGMFSPTTRLTTATKQFDSYKMKEKSINNNNDIFKLMAATSA